MRRIPWLRLGAVAVLAIAACTPGGGEAEEGEGDGGPIRVGLLAPTTSVAAESAEDMVDGWNLFWEQNGDEVAGRTVETIVEDDGGDPDVALSKARLLVEQRDVHMLVGLLFAHTGYAVADFVRQAEVPTFYPVVAADDLTQRARVPTLIRLAGNSSSQPMHPFGEWVAETDGCRRLVTIASDYAYGYEHTGGFVNTFTDAGGEVVAQLWNPIDASDFSSYLVRIQRARPECVFTIQVGATAIRFLQQWRDFGLSDRIQLYVGEDVMDQSILRGIEDPELVEGVIGGGHYAEGWDNQATQEYVQAFEERYGKLSSYFDAAMYTAAQWVAEAIERVDGNVEDTEAFLNAIREIQLDDSPMGPVSLDEYGNTNFPVFVRRAETRDDGRLWNVPVQIYENVSQFYQYEPEAFLEQPVYSREYQGVDWP